MVSGPAVKVGFAKIGMPTWIEDQSMDFQWRQDLSI